MTRALLVFPEFRSASFWNYRETCRLVDACYPAAPLGICTVAALLPREWEIRLVDRNVEPWEDSMLDWADLVFTGGMIAQQLDCLDIIREARRRGKTIVVGGPDATSSPHLYGAASHLVLGEGEITLPLFLADLQAGTTRHVYQDKRRADLKTSPTPRFDLLKFDRYNHVGIQWSRGCPLNCEFCDITELYGRIPRVKSPEQILKELQTLYDLGYRGHVDLVDDNLIGAKKSVKEFLPRLTAWLEEHDWPFEFTTEASLNLADDEDLMRKMREAGFFAIFVGIESPDEATLLATRKGHNAHRSIADSIRKIYRHGMFVNAGWILGFDTEKGSVAQGIIDCIEDTGIPVNMAGLLFALPGTQLTRRLASEGRLPKDFDVQPEGAGDQCTTGLNFETRRPRTDVLRDYLKIVETIYEPQSYFSRVGKVGRMLDSSTRHFKPTSKLQFKEVKGFFRMILRLGLQGATRHHFWRAFLGSIWRNPKSIRYTGALLALYLHFGPFAKYVGKRIRETIAKEEAHPLKADSAPAPERSVVPHLVAAARLAHD